jgi:hypothetical protein
MIKARLYEPADAVPLDLIAGFNPNRFVRLDFDRIVVTGEPGAPTAVLVWRPTGYIHELQFYSHSLAERKVADRLVGFAVNDALSHQWPICHATFIIDPSNAAMLRYVRGLPGIVENPGIVFTLQFGEAINGKGDQRRNSRR